MAITFLVHVVTFSFFQLCLVDMVRYRKNNIRINFERGPNMAQIIPGSLVRRICEITVTSKVYLSARAL